MLYTAFLKQHGTSMVAISSAVAVPLTTMGALIAEERRKRKEDILRHDHLTAQRVPDDELHREKKKLEIEILRTTLANMKEPPSSAPAVTAPAVTAASTDSWG
ncbi:hypothetical protein HOY80DRAFT_1141712 [Tuber brumale]|nr:hypothetical protein HOY80DRAFT_1141712 [Tuber brumale]